MKKLLTIIILITMTFLLSGCFIYGQGETVGYIYAIDDGIIWDHVWIKSDLESSEGDCYLLRNGNVIKEELEQTMIEKKSVRLNYYKHFSTLSSCGEMLSINDEITGMEGMFWS